MKMTSIVAAGALALGLSDAASASIMVYDIVGDGHHATFTLRTNPTDFVFVDDGFDFGISTTGTFDGVADLAGITFYANPFPDASANPGGLTYLDNSFFYQFNIDGLQLYSGPESAPTLLAFGPTRYTDIYSGAELTISAVEAAPEPATWATMVIGFGLIGGACRARRRTVAFA